MYTNKHVAVPATVTAGMAGTLPNTGGPNWLVLIIGIVCFLVGVFAIVSASGALYRIVPASWRRGRN